MVLAVVGTNAEARHVLAEGRAMVVLTLDEIANLLASAGSVITETKKLFPGAVVARSRLPSPDWYPDGEEIPF